jgi:hypothetical protein
VRYTVLYKYLYYCMFISSPQEAKRVQYYYCTSYSYCSRVLYSVATSTCTYVRIVLIIIVQHWMNLSPLTLKYKYCTATVLIRAMHGGCNPCHAIRNDRVVHDVLRDEQLNIIRLVCKHWIHTHAVLTPANLRLSFPNRVMGKGVYSTTGDSARLQCITM